MTDLTERLHLERDAIATVDTDTGLRDVRRIVRQRRRRSAVVGAAAAGGLLVAGVVGIVWLASEPSEIVLTDTSPQISDPSDPDSTPTASTTPVSIAPVSGTDIGIDVAPSLGEAIVGSAVGGELVSVSAELRSVAGVDASFNFQVPWDGGFLVGNTGNSEQPWQAFFSPNGQTWEPREIRAGNAESSGGLLGDPVRAAGDRLVVPSLRWDGSGWTPLISSTTDLETWTTAEIPVAVYDDLPALVEMTIGSPPALAVNERGWITTVSLPLQINTTELATQRLGRPVSGVTQNITDEGFRLLVDAEEPGVAAERLDITWNELEAELGAELVDAVRSPTPPEVWTGTWDGSAPVRHDIPTERADSWIRDFVTVGDGFVVVRSVREDPAGGPQDMNTELVSGEAIDGGGIDWTVLDPPISESVVSAFPLDGDLGVFAEAADGTLSAHRVDLTTQTWTPVEVPDLPGQARELDQFGMTATGAVLLDIAPEPLFDTGPTTGTIEKNGLRYTWKFEFPTSTYAVTSIDNGEILVEESIDIGEIQGSFDLAFEHLVGGVGIDTTTITDPQTGDVLMEISAGEMNATTSQDDPDAYSEPELRLVATADGIAWFVGEAPATGDNSYVERMTVSDHRLLVQVRGDADEWFVVDLT